MIILAIESTTNICSVAVLKDGKLAGYMEEDIPQRQLTWIMPAIDKMLKKSKIKYKNINYIAATNGPGSYTGLRLGIITAKTTAQILDIPILAYNTLEALAYNCVDSKDIILPVLDAKKSEIYAGVFLGDGKKLKQILPPRAYDLDEIVKLYHSVGNAYMRSLQKQIIFTGTALYKYKDDIVGARRAVPLQIKHKFAPKKLWHPKASALCVMAYGDIVGQAICAPKGAPYVGQAFRPANNNAKLLRYMDLQAYYLRDPDIGIKKTEVRRQMSE